MMSRSRTIQSNLMGVMLSIVLVLNSTAMTPQAHAGEIDTDEIMDAAIEATNCLEYCITGVCFWLVCYGFYCDVEWTFKIRHYNPEVVASAFPEAGENPWTNVNDQIGEDNKELSDDIALDMGGMFSSGGNNTESQHADEHRNMQYKDVEIFGHPLATIINLYAGGEVLDMDNLLASFVGLDTDEDQSTGLGGDGWEFDLPWDDEGSNSQEDTMNSQSADGQELDTSIDGLFDSAFDMLDDSMDTALEDLGGDFGAATSNSDTGGYLCPHRATSFMPYFMASWDYYQWRWGIPDMFSTEAWIPGEREIQEESGQTWGAVYPRAGTVIQHSDPKSAAVTSQRAADVITRDQQGHIYLYLSSEPYWPWHWPPGPVLENDERFKWQVLLPEVRDYCEIFGKDDRATASGWGGDLGVPDDHRFVFALWRRYECCINHEGFFLAAPSLMEICFTGMSQ